VIAAVSPTDPTPGYLEDQIVAGTGITITKTAAEALSIAVPVVWEDLRFPFTRGRRGALSKPDFDYTNLGLLFPESDATEIVYFIAQIPHAYLLESDLSCHVHFVQTSASTPTFKMDYRWYKNGGDPTVGFTTITASTFKVTYPGSGSILQIAEFPMIDGDGIDSVSSILDIKLYRDDGDIAADVLGKEFDIHYQTDTRGSLQEYSKS
jgi:hypothetical protein